MFFFMVPLYCRQSVSYVALAMITLTRFPMGLKRTHCRSTTWLTTCEYCFCCCSRWHCCTVDLQACAVRVEVNRFGLRAEGVPRPYAQAWAARRGLLPQRLNAQSASAYRFFVMYLINKDETEHTGQVWQLSLSHTSIILELHCVTTFLVLNTEAAVFRGPERQCYVSLILQVMRRTIVVKSVVCSVSQESYVWKMYQERCWEFFPVGDCFRKQYEDQLS